MPIKNGAGNILAMPGKRFGAATPNGTSLNYSSKPFRSPKLSDYNLTQIAGTTKNSTGAALGACTVQLFRTTDDFLIQELTSDVNGNYSFAPTEYGPFYIVAYKVGVPDVAGTTVNTLTGT